MYWKKTTNKGDMPLYNPSSHRMKQREDILLTQWKLWKLDWAQVAENESAYYSRGISFGVSCFKHHWVNNLTQDYSLPVARHIDTCIEKFDGTFYKDLQPGQITSLSDIIYIYIYKWHTSQGEGLLTRSELQFFWLSCVCKLLKKTEQIYGAWGHQRHEMRPATSEAEILAS